MWVLDYLDDIDSDMSAFHRVDDARNDLPAPLYFARAERLPAYRGIMRSRVLNEMQTNGASPSSAMTPGRVTVDDTTAIAKLKAEGWLEHNVEGETAA